MFWICSLSLIPKTIFYRIFTTSKGAITNRVMTTDKRKIKELPPVKEPEKKSSSLANLVDLLILF